MGRKLLFETCVVLLYFISKYRWCCHKDHPHGWSFIDIFSSESWKNFASLSVFLIETSLWVVIHQSPLLPHSDVHGLLTEETQYSCRGLSCARTTQNEEVLWRIENALLVGVELHVDYWQHLEHFSESLSFLKLLEGIDSTISVRIPWSFILISE